MGNENTIHTDVIVVGAGMVGSLTALALGACGVDVVLVEKNQPADFDPSHHDLRVSAISYATERMFDAVGAWDALQAMRACPFRRMMVWDQQSEAKTVFNSADIGRPHLGHIVENRVVQLALWKRIRELENVQWCCPAGVEKLQMDAAQALVTLGDNTKIAAPLVVAADGAGSRVRQLAGIAVQGDSYEQQALVATVTTALPQQDITWQRFTADGPQAFLPLTGNRASMVWYQSADYIAGLKRLSESDFLRAMESEFPSQLGSLKGLLGIGSFPLSWQQAEHYVQPRVALVGDAAHSVHPLAGQGVNMGMLDAAALVECVVGRYIDGADIGSLRSLRRYERWRKGENALMIKMLDGIHYAFQPDDRTALVFKALRSAALHGAHNIRPLNSMCMKVAMGIAGDLPRLARGRLPL